MLVIDKPLSQPWQSIHGTLFGVGVHSGVTCCGGDDFALEERNRGVTAIGCVACGE